MASLSYTSRYDKLITRYLMSNYDANVYIRDTKHMNQVLDEFCETGYTFEDRHELDEAITNYTMCDDLARYEDDDTIRFKYDNLSKYGNPKHWNLENIDDLSRLFENINDFPLVFTEALPHWDVSHVTDFSRMFRNCEDFNADISKWDVSSGTNFSSMFENALSYTYAISDTWNIANATNINKMFMKASAYIDHGIYNLNFENVKDKHIKTFANTRYNDYFVRLMKNVTKRRRNKTVSTQTEQTDIMSVIGDYLKNPTDAHKVAQLVLQHMAHSSQSTSAASSVINTFDADIDSDEAVQTQT